MSDKPKMSNAEATALLVLSILLVGGAIFNYVKHRGLTDVVAVNAARIDGIEEQLTGISEKLDSVQVQLKVSPTDVLSEVRELRSFMQGKKE